MSTEVQSDRTLVPELVWLGEGAWVVRTPAVPDNDARRVVAYVEHKDHRVYVRWMRDRQDIGCFVTLRDALRYVGPPCETTDCQKGTA